MEINATRKTDGWFLHAITGEEWLLKLKFRTAKRSFERESLVKSLDLKPLNELPDIPVYGSDPRVTCKNLQGPWQEIQLRIHSLAEVDKPEFWISLRRLCKAFKSSRRKRRPIRTT